MKTLKELTQNDVRELIDYDPETGKCYWRTRDVKWFKDSPKRSAAWKCNNWNSKCADKEITSNNGSGYILPSLFGQGVYLHRLIWFRQTGEWPKGDIDHVNGIRSDNRWENLRDVSHAENNRNMRRPKNNTSGAIGVTKSGSKWRAQIKVNQKVFHLGYFDLFEDALKARKNAEDKFNFHKTHGRD